MPCGARLDTPGSLHHVIVRGIERRNIVDDELDREDFIKRVGQVAEDTHTAIYTWTLMSNHAHAHAQRSGWHCLKDGKDGVKSTIDFYQCTWYSIPMSRPLRIDYPNAWHHVMNRARRGESLFTDKVDYQQFIVLLQETADLFKVKVAAFCLMSTHYHLMLQTPDANLARGMRHLNGVYTQRYNGRHRCDGTLFRGRYKSILVDADSYVLQLVRYIHCNPLKAGMVKRLDQYAWSSHKGYLSKAKKWNWLYKDFVLETLAGQKSDPILTYKQFMAEQEDADLLRVFERNYLPSILGGEKFTARVKKQFFNKKIDKEIPASKGLAPDSDTIINEVCRTYGIKPEKLTSVRRGVVNEPRDVAIYLIRSLRAEPLMRIGAVFKLNRYSSVSSAVMRVKTKLQKDRKLKKRLSCIESNLIKG